MDECLRIYVHPGKRRRIKVKYFGKPVGYVRQNWGSRWRDDRLGERINVYNGYKALLRDLMASAIPNSAAHGTTEDFDGFTMPSWSHYGAEVVIFNIGEL